MTTWIAAKLVSVAKGDAAQNQNPNNVYAVCTISDDSIPPKTESVTTWANDLSLTSLGNWLKNVINAANNAEASLASLQSSVGQQIALVDAVTAATLSTVSVPTIQQVVQIGSVLSAYAALIAAGVIDNTDAGYQQALADGKAATGAQNTAVSAAVTAKTISMPSTAIPSALT